MSEKTLGADVRAKIAEAHGEEIATATAEHVSAGLTDKQAYAVAMRDHGKTNAEVGEGMAPVWGSPTKPGGAGNVVTAGLRALGRDAEITGGAGGGVRKVVVRDSASIMRDEIDRLTAALDAVSKPVDEANAALATLDADPASVVTARTAEIDAEIKNLRAEAKSLSTDEGATAYVSARRESITAKRDAAATATAENAERMREGIESMKATLAVIESMTPAPEVAPAE